MSNHYNVKAPDTGVTASDLFIFDPHQPGTGGLVSNVKPSALPPRDTIFVDTTELQITFLMDPDSNTAEVMLSSKSAVELTDRQVFHLTNAFRSKAEVSLTILFDQWKIVAVIDGKPLLVRHQGWVGVKVDQEAKLPAEYEAILKKIADGSEDVRTMWRYAVVLLMVHDEKARFVETRQDGDTLHFVIETIQGERFSVVRPPMAEEAEQLLLEQVREIVAQTDADLT
jgi:hypothetical protein